MSACEVRAAELEHRWQFQQSKSALEEALAFYGRRPADRECTAHLLLLLGRVLSFTWQVEEAERRYRAAIGILERQGLTQTALYAQALSDYGALLHDRGDFRGAVRWQSRAVQALEGLAPANDPTLLNLMGRLADSDCAAGDCGRAEALLWKVLALCPPENEGGGAPLVQVHTRLGTVLRENGRPDEAMKSLEIAEGICRRSLGSQALPVLMIWLGKEQCLRQAKRFEEAKGYLDKAIQLSQRVFGSEAPFTLMAEAEMGILLKAMGRTREARQIVRGVKEKTDAQARVRSTVSLVELQRR